MSTEIITNVNARGISGITLESSEKREKARTLPLSKIGNLAESQPVRISKRRAGIVSGKTLFVVRLRRVSEKGTQTVRDIVKVYNCSDEQEAQNLLTLKVREAQGNDNLDSD